MKLTEILDQAYVGITGDRVNLISKIVIIGSVYELCETGSRIWGIPAIISSALIGYTSYGLKTLKYYNRTSNHIKNFGTLDLTFAKTLIKGTENKKFTGYCQLQGLYLAAKKYDQLETFYEAKKTVSNNILPNF
ncbi:MAG: hypothetical protein ACP5N1_00520 [Candidatus Woesearchaeota archaeon]